MIKEGWYDGVLMAVQAIKDGKKIQINFTEDPGKWHDCDEIQDGNRLIFLLSCQYRAKPKVRILPYNANNLPRIIGKKVLLGSNKDKGRIVNVIFNWDDISIIIYDAESNKLKTMTPEILASCVEFSDGSPCGVEVDE